MHDTTSPQVHVDQPKQCEFTSADGTMASFFPASIGFAGEGSIQPHSTDAFNLANGCSNTSKSFPNARSHEYTRIVLPTGTHPT